MIRLEGEDCCCCSPKIPIWESQGTHIVCHIPQAIPEILERKNIEVNLSWA